MGASNSHFVIASIRHLARPVEIVAIGRVVAPSGTAIEKSVEVFLTDDLDDRPMLKRNILGPYPVAVGQLDLLTIGSRWQAGAYLGRPDEMKVDGLFTCLGPGRLAGEDLQQPLTRSEGRLTRHEIVAAVPTLVLERSDAVPDDEAADRRFIVPQIELVRALFGVSSRFIQQTVDGWRDPKTRNYWIGKRELLQVREDGSITLRFLRKPARQEVVAYGLLRTDGKVRGMHDLVFQHLSVGTRHAATFLTAEWPFDQPVGLTFTCRPLTKPDGSTSVLVTKIESVAIDYAFSRIAVQHAGSSETPSDDLPIPSGVRRPTNARLKVLHGDRRPTSQRHTAIIPSEKVDLNASGIDVEYTVVDERDVRPPSVMGEAQREEGGVSNDVADAQGDQDTGQALGQRADGAGEPVQKPELQDALRRTVAAVVHIADENGWSVTSWTVTGPRDSREVDGGFDLTREEVFMALDVNGRLVVIADRGTTGQTSLGVLVAVKGRARTADELALFRAASEKCQGHWRSTKGEVDGFAKAGLSRHPVTTEDVALYGGNIARKISALL